MPSRTDDDDNDDKGYLVDFFQKSYDKVRPCERKFLKRERERREWRERERERERERGEERRERQKENNRKESEV